MTSTIAEVQPTKELAAVVLSRLMATPRTTTESNPTMTASGLQPIRSLGPGLIMWVSLHEKGGTRGCSRKDPLLRLGLVGDRGCQPVSSSTARARTAADEYVDRALLDQQAERMACRIGEDIEGFALIV